MVYTSLSSFFGFEMNTSLKEDLLNQIATDTKNGKSYWRAEFNVYEIQILYPQGLVLIWDTIIEQVPGYEDQEPLLSNLTDFVKALKGYSV